MATYGGKMNTLHICRDHFYYFGFGKPQVQADGDFKPLQSVIIPRKIAESLIEIATNGERKTIAPRTSMCISLKEKKESVKTEEIPTIALESRSFIDKEPIKLVTGESHVL